MGVDWGWGRGEKLAAGRRLGGSSTQKQNQSKQQQHTLKRAPRPSHHHHPNYHRSYVDRAAYETVHRTSDAMAAFKAATAGIKVQVNGEDTPYAAGRETGIISGEAPAGRGCSNFRQHFHLSLQAPSTLLNPSPGQSYIETNHGFM